jgi:hypothetical protein
MLALTLKKFFEQDGPAIDLIVARFSVSRRVPFHVERQLLFEK